MVAAAAWLPTPLASSAEGAPLYRWTDAGGAVRYTPELERIPAEALPGVRVLRRDLSSAAVAVFPWGSEEPLSPDAVLAEIAAPAPAQALAQVAPAPRLRSAEAPRAAERSPAPKRSQPVAKPAAREAGPDLYAIQLRATSVTAWLRPLQRTGLIAGRRLYRTQTSVEGRVWERLRLGFYATHGEARAALSQLQASFPGAWVDHIDAAERGAAARFEIRPSSDVAAEAAFAPAAADEARDYAIQLDAWPLDEGLRVLTRLELLDRHRLYRTTVDVNGAVWERLRLGFFPSLEDARVVLRKIERSFPGAFIARVEPDERIAFAETTLARSG